jgi:soluble P-type ATPase
LDVNYTRGVDFIRLDIPNSGIYNLEIAVFDFNGTLALDGHLSEWVKQKIELLAKQLEIHILTSDTFGRAQQECQDLPVRLKILESQNHTNEKASYLAQFGHKQVVAIGNGANDQLMFEAAALGVAVIGPEGCCCQALLSADLVVSSVDDAIDLLLNPKRIVASLRK